MADDSRELALIDRQVAQLFAHVTEALAGATHALLSAESETGASIVAADEEIDELTRQVSKLVWSILEGPNARPDDLRHLVGVLLILPELERSADLAEHIAQRAMHSLGLQMSPFCRGCVQRMSEVALEMWGAAATAYAERRADGSLLDEADEEIDILHGRLMNDLTNETMPAAVASEVALVGRFYERLGDHAVNLARRIDSLPGSQQTDLGLS